MLLTGGATWPTGLCLPHLLAGVERRSDTPGVKSIIPRTLAKWQDLRGDLERFVSKHEYRNAQPIGGEEATSCRRAFEVMAGRQSVFGNDLRRGEADVAGERGANALSARAMGFAHAGEV